MLSDSVLKSRILNGSSLQFNLGKSQKNLKKLLKGDFGMKKLLWTMIVFLIPAMMFGWMVNGIPVVSTTGSQSSPELIANPNGGIIATWMDDRNSAISGTDVYAQSINSQGSTLWTLNGVAVCTVGNNQQFPKIASDGNGGAYIVWQDLRSQLQTASDIYLSHLNSQGSTLWNLTVCTATNLQINPAICGDGFGGAVIAWEDWRESTTSRIYSQRVTSYGSTLWANGGVQTISDFSSQTKPMIVSSGTSYFYVGFYAANSVVAVVKIGGNDGSAKAVFSNFGTLLAISADTEAAYVAYETSEPIWHATAFKWSAGGYFTWTETVTIETVKEIFVTNQFGDALVTWVNSSSKAFVKKIGSTEWTASVGQSGVSQLSPQVVADGQGGASVVWYDNRSGSYDVYLQHFGSSGISLMTATICAAAGNQQSPKAIADGSNVIAVWSDFRNPTNLFDIYAGSVNSSALWPDLNARAGFYATPTAGYLPLSVNFVDTSANATSWNWNFGDGGISTIQSPNHVYADYGVDTNYLVILIVTNSFGSDTATLWLNFLSTNSRLPQANFNYAPATVYSGDSIKFMDASLGNPTSFAWTFGDGANATNATCYRIFAEYNYDTVLSVQYVVHNQFGSDQVVGNISVLSKTVRRPVVVSFNANPLSGYAPLTVNFVGAVSGSTSGLNCQIIGNGWSVSTSSANHIYNDLGYDYSEQVWLIVNNNFGSTSASVTINIMSSSVRRPQANFYATPTSGYGDFTVSFNDLSVNPANWNWNFGDGGISTTQNPSHVYALVTISQAYQVRLVVTNPFGSSTAYQNIYALGTSTTIKIVIGEANLPCPKLFIGQALANVVDLQWYNNISANNFSIAQGFGGLLGLSGSIVHQGSYSLATVGGNALVMSNGTSSVTSFNKVKYSTYKISKLPAIGAKVNQIINFSLVGQVNNSAGNVIPPSFGGVGSLIVSDSTKISAVWSGNTAVVVSLLTSEPAYVDIIASPISQQPFGADVDKERLWIYPNLLSGGSFSAASEVSCWAYESSNASGTKMPTYGWLSSYAGAEGVLAVSFSSLTEELKMTIKMPHWLTYNVNQWYKVRARVMSTEGSNGHQILVYNYSNIVPASHFDLAANIWYSIPTTWTWIETNLKSFISSDSSYPQLVLKAGNIGQILIDEVQVIQADPELTKTRADSRLHYNAGRWQTFSNLSGWGIETNPGEVNVENSTGGNLKLRLGNDGLTKIKFTAKEEGGGVYTPKASVGAEVGMSIPIKATEGLWEALPTMVAGYVYGVQTVGQYEIGPMQGTANNFIAVGQVGRIIPGELVVAGTARNPYYQFQFSIKNTDANSAITLGEVDYLNDNDNPNYGDPKLY